MALKSDSAFAFEDQGFGWQSVDTVETDGGASFGGAGACAFLGVQAVGCGLFSVAIVISASIIEGVWRADGSVRRRNRCKAL